MSIEFLAEYAATLGLDVYKDKLEEKLDQVKLRRLIEKFLQREKSVTTTARWAKKLILKVFAIMLKII